MRIVTRPQRKSIKSQEQLDVIVSSKIDKFVDNITGIATKSLDLMNKNINSINFVYVRTGYDKRVYLPSNLYNTKQIKRIKVHHGI